MIFIFQFPNPVRDGEFVHVVPDVPHGIKNLRTHILQHGMMRKVNDNDYACLTKEHFYKIMEEDGEDGEFKACHKLTKFHLEVKGQECQRVRLAVQVLSGSVANSFELLGFKNQAEIVHIINNFFDVCDSRTKYDKSLNKYKCGFGVHEEVQCQALQNMIDLMTSLEWRRRGFWSKTMKPFQKGKIKSFGPREETFKTIKFYRFNLCSQEYVEYLSRPGKCWW